MSSKLTIIDNETYFHDLVEAIDHTKKGDRISLATMAFHPPEPTIANLIDSAISAAGRGVKVTFCFDAYALMIDNNETINGPLAPHGFRKKSLPYFEEFSHLVTQMETAGITVGITNIPKTLLHIPYAGRSHIKGAIVNSQWWIGGSNFAGSDSLDCMIGSSDPTQADYLYTLFCGFAASGSVQAMAGIHDVIKKMPDNTQLLVDVGVRNQSCIYDEALRLIDASQEWVLITCQYFPTGKTARHLAMAMKRGVHVRVIFNGNDKKQPGGFARKIYQHASHRGLPKALFDDELTTSHPYMHAKILATDVGMIIGSHNIASHGVALGTAEIAIASSETTLITKAAKMALQLAETTTG